MKILDTFSQGSPEWFEARRGLATASHASEIITAAKGEFSKSAQKYIFALIAECGWAGEDIPEFKTAAMKRGTELEPVAREAFEATFDLKAKEVGLCVADDEICACSPDGLIFDAAGKPVGGLEIKCPLKEEHAAYVLSGGLPDAYKAQVHWSLAVTGLPVWHFWSFHPRFKPLHVVVPRDSYTEKVKAAQAEFVKLYQQSYEKAVDSLFVPVDLAEEN